MRPPAGAGRCVVTTGANSGIGLASAVAIAREGFRSVATVRSADKADAVHRAADVAGVAVETAILDVTDPGGCEAVITRYRPFGLVNNAGINTIAACEDTDDDMARAQFEINAIAPMRLARLAVPHMRSAGAGRIVNVTSNAGRVTLPLIGCYQAAKHAIEASSAALRVEVAADGIKVSCVAPGGVDTAIYQKGFWVDEDSFAGSRYGPAYRRLRMVMMNVGRRQTTSEAVAAVVLEALTATRPRARYLVGADAYALVASQTLLPELMRDRVQRLVFGL